MYRFGVILPEVRQFICNDGSKLKNLEDLMNKIRNTDPKDFEKIYQFHTKEHGNDFAKWVKYTFLEDELANNIEKTQTSDDLRNVLKEFLRDAQQNQNDDIAVKSFWFYYGRELRNLKDFVAELKRFSPEYHINSFDFHMKHNGNDFANWLRDSLKESELAEKIRNMKTPQEVIDLVQSRIDEKEVKGKEIKEKVQKEIEQDVKKEENIPLEQNGEIIVELDEEGKPMFVTRSEKMLEKMKSVKKNFYNKIDFLKNKELIEEEYKRVYDDLAIARKEGHDVFIPSVKIKNVKSKIKYLEASGNESDEKRLLEYLDEIRNEIKEAKEYKKIDVKKEIMALVKEEENSNLITNDELQSQKSVNEEKVEAQ